MISFVPLATVKYRFSAAEYLTYEGSQPLKLLLISSTTAEVEDVLSIRLKDGSATCKISIYSDSAHR